MVTLRPFAALRPPRDRAAAVAAVPYDVVSTAEARILADGNPWSFLRVSRAELALREGTDPRAEAVYETASAHYDELRRSCPLLVEESPSLYVYRLRMERHEQTGIGACFSLDEYERGQILRHEVTRRDTEDDRTRHMLALRAQTGPVLLAYRDRPSVDELVLRATAREPLYDFTAPDGVSHTVWRAETDAAARLVQEFSAVRAFYIADGHHRAASAA